MKDFLTKAFGMAVSARNFTLNSFDYAGFLAMRAVMDHQFLAVDANSFSSKPLRMAASTYVFAKEKAQNTAFNQLSTKLASGDFGPKPDVKKPLLRFAGLMAQNLPRLTASQAAVFSLGIGVAIVGAHIMTNGNAAQTIADGMGLWLGAHPQQRGPVPTQDI